MYDYEIHVRFWDTTDYQYSHKQYFMSHEEAQEWAKENNKKVVYVGYNPHMARFNKSQA
jgi:mannosyltransferase OCH1-like enzyme